MGWEPPTFGNEIYTMLYRPIMIGTLPRGVTTEWVKPPSYLGHMPALRNMPVSLHRHGEFRTSRPLTDTELESYQVKRVG